MIDNATTDHCGKCQRAMRPLQSRCRCGWRRPDYAHADAPRHDPDRHRCAYTNGFRRCPMPATSTATVVLAANHSGPHPGPWFCSWHYATRADPEAAARVLDDLERNPPRREVHARERLVEQHIARHDLRRQPGEPMLAFIARCRAATPAGRLDVDLSMERKRPSPAERKEALVEQFAEHVARLQADGMATLEAERTAVESLAEALLPACPERVEVA